MEKMLVKMGLSFVEGRASTAPKVVREAEQAHVNEMNEEAPEVKVAKKQKKKKMKVSWADLSEEICDSFDSFEEVPVEAIEVSEHVARKAERIDNSAFNLIVPFEKPLRNSGSKRVGSTVVEKDQRRSSLRRGGRLLLVATSTTCSSSRGGQKLLMPSKFTSSRSLGSTRWTWVRAASNNSEAAEGEEFRFSDLHEGQGNRFQEVDCERSRGERRGPLCLSPCTFRTARGEVRGKLACWVGFGACICATI